MCVGISELRFIKFIYIYIFFLLLNIKYYYNCPFHIRHVSQINSCQTNLTVNRTMTRTFFNIVKKLISSKLYNCSFRNKQKKLHVTFPKRKDGRKDKKKANSRYKNLNTLFN